MSDTMMLTMMFGAAGVGLLLGCAIGLLCYVPHPYRFGFYAEDEGRRLHDHLAGKGRNHV
jgi:hypothetical protein